MVQVLEEIAQLEEKARKTHLPKDFLERILGMLDRLSRLSKLGGYSTEYESVYRYIDWIISLPWESRARDVLDLEGAKRILDKNHYGLPQVKDRILEFLSVLILKSKKGEVIRAPIICLVGLVGTGKTTLAYSVAEALSRPFVRIPFGGLGGIFQLRGQSRVLADAEPGQVIKALRRSQVKNPVFLLDEIDRVAEESRADIMGVLVELLDPEQHQAFIDHYIDYPFDLSQVLFIATANNLGNVATAVLDRLEIIQMPSYTDEEKIVIGRNYILPKVLKEAGVPEDLVEFTPTIWSKIVRPLGYDPGMRSLERTIEGILRKIARQLVEEGSKKIRLDENSISQYLPRY